MQAGSYDGYDGRELAEPQALEQFFIEFLDPFDSVIARTEVTMDLVDGTEEASWIGSVGRVGLNRPVLTAADRYKIRDLVETVRRIIPGTPGIEGNGPYDIEMGFLGNEIRLFQIRPFVENKRAALLRYLLQLDEGYKGPGTISSERTLPL